MLDSSHAESIPIPLEISETDSDSDSSEEKPNGINFDSGRNEKH